MTKKQPLRRREFMHMAARGAAWMAAGAAAPLDLAKTDPTWKMQLACSSINFSSLPIEKAIARIAALGFDAVDIWSAHAGCPHLDDVLNRLGPNGLRAVLHTHRIALYSFSVYQGGYPRYAELLGKLGGGVAVRGSTALADRRDLVPATNRFLESLKPELELAEKYDSYLAIENHSGTPLLNYLDSFKALVDRIQHPRLGIALAPYHIQKNGESVEEAISICGKRLFFFYAWQNARGTGQLPGIGPTDCRPWLKALARVGFRYPVVPFMHHEPAPDDMARSLTTSCHYLKSCYRQAVRGESAPAP